LLSPSEEISLFVSVGHFVTDAIDLDAEEAFLFVILKACVVDLNDPVTVIHVARLQCFNVAHYSALTDGP
jgi:hypothetical protein